MSSVFLRMRSARIRDAVWSLVLLSLLGCGSPDPIRQYTVEKQPPSDRMLAAIVPHQEQAWFFKVTGPSSALEKESQAFRQLVSSLHFHGGEPHWDLPQGWQSQPGSGMRFATLQIPAESQPLDVSVTTLPLPPGDRESYLLSNINRWRQQMRLAPLGAEQLEAQTERISLEGGLEAIWVDLQGSLDAARLPSMAGGTPPSGSSGPAGVARPATQPADQPELHYNAPSDWQLGQKEVERGGIRIRRAAAFDLRNGDQSAEVTVTSLPIAAGSELPNINRWRALIELPPLTAEQLAQERKTIEVAGQEAAYYELIGPQQAVLGVIASREENAWFIKMQGDHDLVLQQRDSFREFVRSIQFQP